MSTVGAPGAAGAGSGRGTPAEGATRRTEPVHHAADEDPVHGAPGDPGTTPVPPPGDASPGRRAGDPVPPAGEGEGDGTHHAGDSVHPAGEGDGAHHAGDEDPVHGGPAPGAP